MEISPLYFGLVFAVGFLPFILFYSILKQSEKKKREELEKEAAMRSWACEFLKDGGVSYRLSGTQGGVAWTIEGRRATGKSSGSVSTKRGASTRWSAKLEEFPEALILIAPVSASKMPAFGGVGNFLMQYVAASFLGEEANSIPDMEPVEAGSAKFREQMTVISNDAEAAQKFLNEKTESSILKWRQDYSINDQPGIILWRKNLSLRFQKCIWDPIFLESLVSYGTNLVKLEF